MCTLIVLNRVHPDLPVVLAANRDELFARRAQGPRVLVDAPRVVGGRDAVAGGTWLGLTPTGFFVGVTNEAGVAPRPGLESRGQLVLDLLRRGSVGAGRAWLRTLRADAYNPFYLLFGDADGVWVAHRRGAELHLEAVPAGVHVLPNGPLNSARFPKVARVRGLLESPPRGRAALIDQLRGALSDDAVCVRGSIYGTRSASIVALRPGGVAFYLHAEGAPDFAPFEDHTCLLS